MLFSFDFSGGLRGPTEKIHFKTGIVVLRQFGPEQSTKPGVLAC
jgi:hypothetical protein